MSVIVSRCLRRILALRDAAASLGMEPVTLRAFTATVARDQSGNVAMLFGLMLIVVFLAVGGAIDYGRWLHARDQTLAAVDAAVLAAARVLQIDSKDESGALRTASAIYQENIKGLDTLTDTIQFSVADDGTAVLANGTASIGTLFLQLIEITELPLLKLSESEFSTAKLAVGGNGQQNIEVSLMLDVTGSMSGQKLTDLKAAAKELIDIVVWEDQSEFTSKVALAPFSEGVYVGSSLLSKVAYAPATYLNFNVTSSNSAKRWYRTDCVSERIGTGKYTDAAPTGSNLLPRVYTSSGKCNPGSASPVVPLSNNKTTLKSAIDAFVAQGGTAGHLGTAWAWYLLSPNWASVLPAESKPSSYGDLTALGPSGKPKLRKIAVLMTDGEYNTQYCNSSSPTMAGASLEDRNSGSGKCTAPNGGSTTQARALCAAMKATGIEVLTVGFDLGGNRTAIDTLSQCASSSDKFYNTADGEELKQAFRDIALKISSLYLSK